MKKIGLIHYLKKHKLGCAAYCSTMIIGTIASSVSTVIFAHSVAHITIGNYQQGIINLIICACLAILSRGCYYLVNFFYVKYSTLIQNEIAKDLTSRSFLLASSTFSEHNSGTFLQRIMDDPSRAIDDLSGAFDIITTLVSRTVVIIYVMTLNWIIGLSYIVILTIMSFVERLRMKKRKAGRSEIKKINDTTYSLMGEIIKSERDIKALDLDDELYTITDKQFSTLRAKRRSVALVDMNIREAELIVLSLFSIALLILGVYMMQYNIIAISTYILLFSYKDYLWHFVWEAGHLGQIITDIKISTNRMFSLFNEELYPVEKFGTKTLDNPTGKITFSHVKYAYFDSVEIPQKKGPPKFERTKRKPLFKDLTFEIEPNTTVAFVGESGVGKSTILSLITKLIECDGGSIKIDGTNIKQLTKESLRDTISLINQSPYIFDMSIRDNLKLVKDDATDDEIWSALKRASFDKDVKELTNGLDTKVGETGIKLSGGQKQRLAIARALLKNSKIILFDESTSSLDNFAQSRIQASIDALKGKHTIAIVAHRLSTIKNVDKIYFLDKGKITDCGTFEELFKNNDRFREMFLMEKI